MAATLSDKSDRLSPRTPDSSEVSGYLRHTIDLTTPALSRRCRTPCAGDPIPCGIIRSPSGRRRRLERTGTRMRMNSPVAQLSRRQRRWTAILVVCAGATAAGTFALVRATSHSPNAQNTGPLGPPSSFTLAQPLPASARTVSLNDAVSGLGRPIVLPSSGQVTPSNVDAVWMNQLPDTTSTTIAVTWPAQGVDVEYSRPALSDPLTNYQGQVSQTPGSKVIYLNGTVPALALPPTAIGGWGVVEFVANGANIKVWGPNVDVASLQPIAESIVARMSS
jgi:hypothetical protein